MAVGVVFNDMKAILLGELQHTVRAARRQAIAGRVVKHTDTDEELGLMQLAIVRHHVQVRSGRAARHR